MLAILLATKKWRQYLLGREFIIKMITNLSSTCLNKDCILKLNTLGSSNFITTSMWWNTRKGRRI